VTNIRITLPGNIVVEADVQSATALLQNLSAIQLNQDRIDQTIISNPIIQPKLDTKINQLRRKIKVTKMVTPMAINASVNNPATFQTVITDFKILANLFHYAPSRENAKGRGAYIAGILLDQQIHTIPDLKSASMATSQTIKFAIKRLRDCGYTIETSSEQYTKNTLVQVTRLPLARVKTARIITSSGFKNLAI